MRTCVRSFRRGTRRKTIGDVVDGLYDVGIGHVLVVDGHSEDDIREIARVQPERIVVDRRKLIAILNSCRIPIAEPVASPG